jgi:DNA helicase HerA-like ATPase
VIIGRKGTGKTSFAKSIIKNLNRVIIIDSLGEYGDVAILVNFDDLVKYIHKKKFKIRLIPIDEIEFNDYLEYIFRTFNNITLVIDEINLFQSPYYLPTGLSLCLRLGRHKKISVIAIARRPAEFNRDLTALTDKFVIFRITEPRDLKYIADYTDIDIEKVKNLKNFEYIEYEV